MRIAHITWSMKTGGLETMLVDIVNEQVKICEVRVYVVNEYYDKVLLDNIDPQVKVVLCHRQPNSNNPMSLVKLNVSLLCYQPDIVHCHQSNMAKVLWFPFKKVLTLHNTHSISKYFGKYSRIFCISRAVRDYAASEGFPNGVVVYNGIHTEQIAVKDYTAITDTQIKRMVCVGRLHPDKGQRLIIEAMNELVNKRHIVNITCDLIGDGDERSALEELIAKFKLIDYIHLLGKKTRSWVYPHLKDYDLYVLPSISEGFGLSLAEACVAKLPVLTCDLAGPMEVIDNGRLGAFFHTGEYMALANAVENILKGGIVLERIEEACTFVKINFDVAMTAQRYIVEYQKIHN